MNRVFERVARIATRAVRARPLSGEETAYGRRRPHVPKPWPTSLYTIRAWGAYPIAFDADRNPAKFRYDAVVDAAPLCANGRCPNPAAFHFRRRIGSGDAVAEEGLLLCRRHRDSLVGILAAYTLAHNPNAAPVLEFCSYDYFSNTDYYYVTGSFATHPLEVPA